MSTSNSLRTVARGEQAYRKHLKARREPAGDGDSTKGKGWTFSKLEYLSRTQLLEPEQDRKDGKMSEARWAGREQAKKQQEAIKVTAATASAVAKKEEKHLKVLSKYLN